MERPRGARLARPDRAPHPVYAAQSLFSIYVHTAPTFAEYPETSVFYGREITPATPAERFRHSLGRVSLLLLEAALYDAAVRNVHFAVLSETSVPLYNGGMLWLQLVNEKRSRVGETHTFKELLRQDQVRPPLRRAPRRVGNRTFGARESVSHLCTRKRVHVLSRRHCVDKRGPAGHGETPGPPERSSTERAADCLHTAHRGEAWAPRKSRLHDSAPRPRAHETAQPLHLGLVPTATAHILWFRTLAGLVA